MTVAELLSRISSREISEWMAFAHLEPFGYEADMFGHAQTASLIVEVNRDVDKRPTPFLPADFMPKIEESIETEDPDERAKQVGERLFADLGSL